MGRVLVVGSLNMDLVVTSERLPRPGETLPGRTFSTHPGGKGANQAAAAAKLGAAASIVGCVGTDAFGAQLCDFLAGLGVDVSRVSRTQTSATGVALIVVDAAGQNSIVVVPGANAELAGGSLALSPQPEDVVLCQLEVPLPTVRRAFELARAAGARTLLNPAPALAGAAQLLDLADVVLLNELELATLLGSAQHATEPAQALRAARQLATGNRLVIVTLGAQGVVAVSANTELTLPGHAVRAVDTTGAGDTFAGALAAALADGRALPDALSYANAAAACSVLRPGAAEASPTTAELGRFLSSDRYQP